MQHAVIVECPPAHLELGPCHTTAVVDNSEVRLRIAVRPLNVNGCGVSVPGIRDELYECHGRVGHDGTRISPKEPLLEEGSLCACASRYCRHFLKLPRSQSLR